MTTLHTKCRVKNIWKRNQRRIQIRPHCEVFVQHSIHDVQLPIPGQPRITYLVSSPSSQQRTVRMYYILKERWIIKHFAVIHEELMSEWDHIRGKTKLPKNSLYEYRERVFSSPVRSLNRIFSTCMPEISHYTSARIQGETEIRVCVFSR